MTVLQFRPRNHVEPKPKPTPTPAQFARAWMRLAILAYMMPWMQWMEILNDIDGYETPEPGGR